MPVPAGSVSDFEPMVKSSVSAAVPSSASVMVCAVSKVEPVPVPTVTLEVPAASRPMLAGLSVKVQHRRRSSSSVMVTVCRAPTALPLRLASIRTVSPASSIRSWTAVTTVVADEAAVPVPAGSVSDVEAMVKSSVSVAVPSSARVMVCAVSKVEPVPVETVMVEVPAASPMLARLTVKVSTGGSSSSVMVTVCRVPTALPLRLAVDQDRLAGLVDPVLDGGDRRW